MFCRKLSKKILSIYAARRNFNQYGQYGLYSFLKAVRWPIVVKFYVFLSLVESCLIRIFLFKSIFCFRNLDPHLVYVITDQSKNVTRLFRGGLFLLVEEAGVPKKKPPTFYRKADNPSHQSTYTSGFRIHNLSLDRLVITVGTI